MLAYKLSTSSQNLTYFIDFLKVKGCKFFTANVLSLISILMYRDN